MLTLTLHDPRPGLEHTQSFDLLDEPAHTANMIAWYARHRGIPPEMVGHSTVTPAGRKLFKQEI